MRSSIQEAEREPKPEGVLGKAPTGGYTELSLGGLKRAGRVNRYSQRKNMDPQAQRRACSWLSRVEVVAGFGF